MASDMKDCDRPRPPIQCIAAPSSSSFSVRDWRIAVRLDYQLTLGLVPTPRRLKSPPALAVAVGMPIVVSKVYTTLKSKILLILALAENIHGQPV
ncbi:hypothetical protein RU639_012051 [Aspergillus parasiticus]